MAAKAQQDRRRSPIGLASKSERLSTHEPAWPGWEGAEDLARLLAFDVVRHCDLRALRGRLRVLRRHEIPRWSNARRGERFDSLLAAHLVAGSRNGADPGDVLALAVAYAPEDRIAHFNLDLDGGGDLSPEEILRRLASAFGENSFLVTTGSGREGRYRATGRLVRAISVQQYQTAMRRILRGLGIEPNARGAEVFPSTRDGRLPFGAGGCERFDASLTRMGVFAPPVLARELLALRPVPLLSLAKKFPEIEERAPEVSRRRERSKRMVRSADPSVGLLLRDGAAPGERDSAIYRIILEFYRRGMPRDEILTGVRRWIEDGGISRTRGGRDARSTRREIERLPARIDKIFATHPRPGVVRSENLTADEILALDEIVRAVCRRFRRADPLVLGAIAFRALSRFKASARARLDGTRIGYEEWEEWGGEGYVKGRERLGIFFIVRDYLSTRTCARLGISPIHARARDYGTTFAFDLASPSPKRPLGTSWSGAVREARAAVERRRKRQQREARKASEAVVQTQLPAAPARTLPSALPPLLAAKIRSSSERHERERERARAEGIDRGDRRVLRGLRGVELPATAPVVRARSGADEPEVLRASPSGVDHGKPSAAGARTTGTTERTPRPARPLSHEPDEGSVECDPLVSNRRRGEYAAAAGRRTLADESDQETDLQAASGRSFRPSPSVAAGIMLDEDSPPERSIVALSYPNGDDGKSNGGAESPRFLCRSEDS